MLDGVFGVDINPYAVALARFRLLVEALRASSIWRLKEAPGYRVNVTVGDSLLHGRRFDELDLGSGAEQLLGQPEIRHAFLTEDLDEVNRILGQQYQVVVVNPPYITVKDKAINELYRKRFRSCFRKYSMRVPFTEQFFELSIRGGKGFDSSEFVGMITADSFMKREFGRELVQNFIPTIELTHVIATKVAYIPGHNTPTVILLGRNRPPVFRTVRAVMGIKGESTVPSDPAKGLAWTAIVDQVDMPGTDSEYVSVRDLPRADFNNHPWSLGGGYEKELKDLVEVGASKKLVDVVDVVGVLGMTNADDIMLASKEAFLRKRVEEKYIRQLVTGECVRDWGIVNQGYVAFPYEAGELVREKNAPGLFKWFWRVRTSMGSRATFSKRTYFQEGRPWWEWHQIALDRLVERRRVLLAEIATHNHFAIDSNSLVSNQTAPIIVFPIGLSAKHVEAVLGLLNSSTGCFWLKQMCFPKGGDQVGTAGARVPKTLWDQMFSHNTSRVKLFPIIDDGPTDLASILLEMVDKRSQLSSAGALKTAISEGGKLANQRENEAKLIRAMLGLQEELDWRCYKLYGVLKEDLCYRDGGPDATWPARHFVPAGDRSQDRGEVAEKQHRGW